MPEKTGRGAKTKAAQAARKTNGTKSSGNARKSAGKAAEKRPQKRGQVIEKEEKQTDPGLMKLLVPYILAVAAIFITVCFFSNNVTGIVGEWTRRILYGLFGGGAFAIPVLIIVIVVFWNRDIKSGREGAKAVFAGWLLVDLSSMLHFWAGGSRTFTLSVLWDDGTSLLGGGAVGGVIGEALRRTVGIVGAHIIGISVLVLLTLFLFGLTPYSVWLYLAYKFHKAREERKNRAEPQPVRKKYILSQKPSPELGEQPAEEPVGGRRRFNPQADLYDKRRFVPEVEVDDGINGGVQDEEPDEIPDIDDYETEGEPDGDVYDEVVRETSDLPYGDDTGTIPDTEETQTAVCEEARQADNLFEEESETPELESEEDDSPPFDIDDNVRTEYIAPVKTTVKSVPKKNETAELIDKEGIDVLERFTRSQKELEEERMAKIRESESKDDDSALTVTRQLLGGEGPEKEEKPEYVFPPISLLNLDTSPKNTDISEELHTNAAKLVETLRSFKVRTKIVNVSRGPTITRYELQPEEGIRVRAIANLVDDIALNLATTGVRIEAPIPGKAAVGIEVPNKTVSTVYLRELIDTPQFRNAPSRINVCLGVDVAGSPVFLDIAKMPHLLIAGATGMGKSVCINSMIVSLLYKANPDEVKLILVDPKKVELNIYNGLPHLLVPVVSDPKKAAGALQWAVTEMERRFDLIEEVGVRDLKNYNAVTKDDPDKEFLPQIVIIIDELADLMMTASNDVETSICRLAQKARAAGMHLIIGTQRPSVDVITGLIKANVPSRIAFTVSSQIDSRTIIDMAGAEKLIGRGDMLYSPVSASKPMRVQGSFVSENEVENIVGFIKAQATSVYSSDIMESIDRAAEQCGQNKKSGAGAGFAAPDEAGGGDHDSMLKAAIELAVESGKISTSLIQRRLSLGYGRAAKLIDAMQEMGIVSPPDGQKPRSVLISKERYMEMVVNGEDFTE
ncbi:MAG: DNA translocase FtsK [Firmicutes bacterium]|nr:DNA translocase FtsK [Bacillota bacterium]